MATIKKSTEAPFLKEGEAFTKDKLIQFIKDKETYSKKNPINNLVIYFFYIIYKMENFFD